MCSEKKFTTDYEMAMLNAIPSVFPDAEIHGCNFHFGACLYRNIEKCGLKIIYDNKTEFYTKMRCLFSQKYLPCNEVKVTFVGLFEANFFFTFESLNFFERDI